MLCAIPYSRKIWQSILQPPKCPTHIYMYGANILAIAIWGSTAKFNSRQYFQLYGTFWLCTREYLVFSIYYTGSTRG